MFFTNESDATFPGCKLTRISFVNGDRTTGYEAYKNPSRKIHSIEPDERVHIFSWKVSANTTGLFWTKFDIEKIDNEDKVVFGQFPNDESKLEKWMYSVHVLNKTEVAIVEKLDKISRDIQKLVQRDK